jgi:hypothetical protein
MEYDLLNVRCGSSRFAARCSPDEYLVAKGEAVAGRGFRRTGDDEVVDNGEESVSARVLIGRDGICSLLFAGAVSGGLLAG